MAIDNINKNGMLRYVDKWMIDHGYPTMMWHQIEEAEGGHGSNRLRSIADAVKKGGSHPGRWFLSGQTDLSFYNEPAYVYSLLWATYRTSGSSYHHAAAEVKGKAIADIGGSIFTAHLLLKGGVEHVTIYNFEDSPQVQFGQWLVKERGWPVDFCFDKEEIKRRYRVGMMKAYLEHFRNVDDEINSWCTGENALHQVYVSNSFCEIAYGHYIPLQVNGADYMEKRAANKAFTNLMADLGYTKERIVFFNSRLSRYTKED